MTVMSVIAALVTMPLPIETLHVWYGLAGTVVLRNNGGDNLVLNANGGFAFNTTLASGDSYAVTVQTQPTSRSGRS